MAKNTEDKKQDETKAAAKTDLVAVQFTKHWTRYNQGEVAGFKKAEADRLVNKLKVAKLYVADSEA